MTTAGSDARGLAVAVTAADGWLTHNDVRAQLQTVDANITELLGDASRDPVIAHVLARPGKQVRPALLLLAAALGDCRNGEAERAAAAIELLHVGSLCHDDVMDAAESRRGIVSANRRWGNGSSLAAGSYLIARALGALTALGPDVTVVASAACADLCAGQLHDIEAAFDLDLGVDDVMSLLRRKTGALFRLPCRVGSLVAGVDDATAQALDTYGERLGVAFQLVDDVLDYTGDSLALGKQAHSDLHQGAYRLPVLLAVASGDASARRLRDLLTRLHPTADELEEAIALVAASPAIRTVRDRARADAAAAVAALDGIGDGLVSVSLRRLADFVIDRSV